VTIRPVSNRIHGNKEKKERTTRPKNRDWEARAPQSYCIPCKAIITKRRWRWGKDIRDGGGKGKKIKESERKGRRG